MDQDQEINPTLHKSLIEFYNLYIKTYMRKNHNPSSYEEDRLMTMAQEIFKLLHESS